MIQIYATGLSGTGVITAKIGSEVVTQPYYAGPAPGFAGVQQIDLILPTDLTGNTRERFGVRRSDGRAGGLQPGVSVAISQ